MAKEGSTIELGCLPIVISIFILWALLFGITWDGVHYDTSCSCERGVSIDKTLVRE